jgi:hypothetical protein
VPGGDAQDGQSNLIRRRVLCHIAERACLEGARDMNRVVVHAEDEDAGRLIFNHQPPDHFQPAAPWQVEIHDDKIGAILLETRQGFLRRHRFVDLCVWLDRDEAAETGMNDRMVIDDKNLHASPAKEEMRLRLFAAGKARVAVTRRVKRTMGFSGSISTAA